MISTGKTKSLALNLSVLLIMLLHPQVSVAEGAEGADHRHHVAAVGGFAHHHGKDANYLGLEYEYRLNERWSIGGFYEQTFNGFDIEALGITGILSPGAGWKLTGGIGSEGKLDNNKSKRLLRAGIGYDFHVGHATVTPLFTVDWIEDNSDAYYLGVAVGFGF